MALATGLRAANITGMRWEQVDLERRMAWVHPDQAKARRAIPVPLNSKAVALLQKQPGKHREKVFTFRGAPFAATTTKAWYSVVKKAGLAPLRFHDLRHTIASRHLQQGTPLSVLQELAGWQSSAMVSRYAHLGPSIWLRGTTGWQFDPQVVTQIRHNPLQRHWGPNCRMLVSL